MSNPTPPAGSAPTRTTTGATAPHIDTGRMQTNQPEGDALVSFGATGDLAMRELFP